MQISLDYDRDHPSHLSVGVLKNHNLSGEGTRISCDRLEYVSARRIPTEDSSNGRLRLSSSCETIFIQILRSIVRMIRDNKDLISNFENIPCLLMGLNRDHR